MRTSPRSRRDLGGISARYRRDIGEADEDLAGIQARGLQPAPPSLQPAASGQTPCASGHALSACRRATLTLTLIVTLTLTLNPNPNQRLCEQHALSEEAEGTSPKVRVSVRVRVS